MEVLGSPRLHARIGHRVTPVRGTVHTGEVVSGYAYHESVAELQPEAREGGGGPDSSRV